MKSDRVLLVADEPGMILEPLGRAWIRYGDFPRHDLVCSSEIHPFELCKRAEQARLVHWIDPLTFTAHPNAARVPQVVMLHHMTEPEAGPILESAQFADFITTSSQRWRKRLHDLTGREAVVIPYSVDSATFVPMDQRAAKAALGLPPEKYVIGFSARADANAFGRKGIDLFLDVLGATRSEWSDIAVALIGRGWGHLRKTIEGLGVEAVVFEPNRTEDTATVYPAMDVFLCTSREEGGPCTILEAMACEVPVITTDVGHVPEVVSDGENGFVIAGFVTASFVDRIRALRANASKRESIRKAGRKFIVEHRDERIAHRGVSFEEIYRSAEANFRKRKDIATRVFPMTYLRLRYRARQALRMVLGSD